MENNNNTDRRGFLGTITTGAATLGLATLFQPLQANAGDIPGFNPEDPDAWFKKIKGKKHSIVFDVTQPHEVFPFAWPRVFLMTNEKTGTVAKDCGVVVVLRHSAIGYAMEDRLWTKYNLGEVFKVDDAETKKPATRNPFWQPKPGTYKFPGIGEVQIGINELQSSGVMFCVCNAALTVYSGAIADGMKMSAEDIYKDWVSGLLPGIQMVPSGVWAVGRAQENGCGYCFAS
ncbi:MAG TPA: twin-arginine translocation signal domain-containing protein [Chitinophagaceae bacterium]|nr:twin-arginine translocation signal domain-containing protein [Chitinophagaceae bacterium]